MTVPNYWRHLYEAPVRPTLQRHAQWFRDAARPSILDDAAQFARFWRMLRSLVETDCSVVAARNVADSIPGVTTPADKFALAYFAGEAADAWFAPTPGQWIPTGGVA